MASEREILAIEHLGNVLYMLSDLVEGDQTVALKRAIEFYNEARPNARIEPTGKPMRLVSEADKNLSDVLAADDLRLADALLAALRDDDPDAEIGSFEFDYSNRVVVDGRFDLPRVAKRVKSYVRAKDPASFVQPALGITPARR